MSMTIPSLADLVAQSGTSAPAFFNRDSKIGDKLTGTIADVPQVRQARDPQTNKLRTWDGGDPVLQVIIPVQTEGLEPIDENDDGVRSIFVKWWGTQRKALLEALHEAGQSDLSVGQTFIAEFVATEKNANKSLNDTKLYKFTIS